MILITGSTGFIGSYLVRDLSKDYILRCIIRKKKIEPTKNTELFYADILDKASLEKAFNGIKIVIHVAALTDGKKEDILKTNIEGTRNLVELSKKYKIERFIFISSDSILLENKGPYAQSKVESEKIVIDSGLNYTILRPNWVYDDNGEKDLKQIIYFVKNFPIVPIIGDGNYKLQPVHVKDLVYATKKVLESKKSYNNIYSLGGSEEITFNEMVDEVSKNLSLKRKKLHIPITLLDIISPITKISKWRIKEIVQSKITNNNKAIKDLDYNPVSIRESLSRMLKWKSY